MDKTAQRRGIINKLHEGLNFPARSAEKLFKPQFEEVMKSLVSKDDTIRSILLGKKTGRPLPSAQLDGTSAKELLSQAKSYIARREYISAVTAISRFHKKMQDVVNMIDSLNFDVSKIHHQFLFGKKMPEKKYLEQLSDLESRIASQQDEFVKQAGLVDSLKNLFTERGRALRAWEKRYEERVAPIRDGAKAQLEASQSLLSSVLEHLRTMASYRAARKIDPYVDEAKQIKSSFEGYDRGKDGFRNFYNTVIRPHVDTQRKMEAEEAAQNFVAPAVPVGGAPVGGPTGTMNAPPLSEAFNPVPGAGVTGNTTPGLGPVPQGPDTKSLGVTFPGNTPSTMLPPPPRVPPDVTPVAPAVPSLPVPGSEPPSKLEQVHSDIMKEWEAKNQGKTSSYNAFIESLEVFSDEDPALLAAHISKYARAIQADDPDTAIQLFKIAKSLRG